MRMPPTMPTVMPAVFMGVVAPVVMTLVLPMPRVEAPAVAFVLPARMHIAIADTLMMPTAADPDVGRAGPAPETRYPDEARTRSRYTFPTRWRWRNTDTNAHVGARVGDGKPRAQTQQHTRPCQYRQFADDIHVVSRVEYALKNATRPILLTAKPAIFSNGLGE